MVIRIVLFILAILFFIASAYFFRRYGVLTELARYYGAGNLLDAEKTRLLVAAISNLVLGVGSLIAVCLMWLKNKRAAMMPTAPIPPGPPKFD
jgi:hypothetical protein